MPRLEKPQAGVAPNFLTLGKQYASRIGSGLRKCASFEGRELKGYSLSGPVEGLSGPRQYPFASATSTSPW